MPRIVDRWYLIDQVLLNRCYYKQDGNYLLCFGINCEFCEKSVIVEEEPQKNKFNSSNSVVDLWKITYYRNDPSVLTIIPGN